MAETPAPPAPRKEITPEEISHVPLGVVKMKYLITERGLLTSGLITQGITPLGHISESPKQRRLLGNDEAVYVETYGTVEPKTLLYVLTKPEKIYHPVTGAFFGYRIRVKGVIEMVGTENGYQKARINKAFEEILPQDPLGPHYTVEAPVEPLQPHRRGRDG